MKFIHNVSQRIQENGVFGTIYLYFSDLFNYLLGPYKAILTVFFAFCSLSIIVFLAYNSSVLFWEMADAISHEIFSIKKDWFSAFLFWTSIFLFYGGMIASDGFASQNLFYFLATIWRFAASVFTSKNEPIKWDLIRTEQFQFTTVAIIVASVLNIASVDINYTVFAKKQQKKELSNLSYTNQDGLFVHIDTLSSPEIQELQAKKQRLQSQYEKAEAEVILLNKAIHGEKNSYGSKQLALSNTKNDLARMAYQNDLQDLASVKENLANTQRMIGQVESTIQSKRSLLARRNKNLAEDHQSEVKKIEQMAWWRAFAFELALFFLIPFASIGTRNMKKNKQKANTTQNQTNNGQHKKLNN